MYLKQASRKRNTWRLRIWLLLALAYASTGLLWLSQERPVALLEASGATPTVAATETVVVNQEALDLVARGDLYFDQGNITAALESYEEAVAADPELAIAYARWGKLLNLRYKSDEALIRTERAITLAPDEPEALAAHSMSLTWTEDFAEAIRYAERAIAADPEYAPGYAFLADAYVDSQQYDSALETAQQAVDVNPDDVWSWLILGYVYESLGRYDEAITAYEEGLEVNPLSFIHNSIGRIQRFVKQDYDAAIESFQQATFVDPRNPEAYAELGNLYIGLENLTAAQDYVEKGIEQDPTFGRNHALLGIIYYQQLNFEAATESLETAVSYGYSNQLVYIYLGLAHAYLDQCDEAKPWLDRVLAEDPESNLARVGMERCNIPIEPADPPPDPEPTS